MAGGLDGQRVVVTGASGFIGRAAVGRLIGAGAQVTALLRQRHGAGQLSAVGARPVLAALRAGEALGQALAGADVLVHLAYDMRADGPANLAAFAALLAAAERAGVSRIVHASSIVVYDDWPTGRIVDGSPIGLRPALGYRAAKIAMEQRLLAGTIPATILQPTIVWGSGSALWTERPIRQLRGGGLVLPDPCGHAPLVHVEDVAAAIVLAAARTGPGYLRVPLTGPDSPTWDRLFESYRAIAGGTLLREPAALMLVQTQAPAAPGGGPGAAARVSAALRQLIGSRRFEQLVGLAARVGPQPAPARPGPGDLAVFTASPRISSEVALSALGFTPTIGLDSGLALLRASYGTRATA